MILFNFKNEPEVRGEEFPCSNFRWTFQIGKWFIGFCHQHQGKETGKWRDSHTKCYEIIFTKEFKFGIDHIYYDGPHCLYNFGFITIQWGRDWCDKCYGER